VQDFSEKFKIEEKLVFSLSESKYLRKTFDYLHFHRLEYLRN